MILDKVEPKQHQLLFTLLQYYFPKGINFDDISKTVTILYQNPANVQVPILWMVQAAAQQFQGSSADSVERLLETLRSDAAKLT